MLMDEFRDGNVPAGQGIKEIVDEVYKMLTGVLASVGEV